jgi:hypothetical protein
MKPIDIFARGKRTNRFQQNPEASQPRPVLGNDKHYPLG